MFSCLEDRYGPRLADLTGIVGEKNFVYFMVQWSIAYVEALTKKQITVLSEEETKNDPIFKLRLFDAVKEEEKETKHQMGAVLSVVRKILTNITPTNKVHFGLTSEDIMHNARCTQIDMLITKIHHMEKGLRKMVNDIPNYTILEKTHGQPATPVQLTQYLNAKMGYTPNRIRGPRYRMGGSNGQLTILKKFYKGKTDDLAMRWEDAIEKRLPIRAGIDTPVGAVGLLQIGPDNAEMYSDGMTVALRLRSFSRALWDHTSRGILDLLSGAKQVGSSAMPHKVNPIQFENAEGCFSNAYNLLRLAHEANIDTRGLRDLSNSVVNRHTLEGWIYLYLGLDSLVDGLFCGKYLKTRIAAELRAHPECMSEVIRYTKLTKTGVDPYWALKKKFKRKT